MLLAAERKLNEKNLTIYFRSRTFEVVAAATGGLRSLKRDSSFSCRFSYGLSSVFRKLNSNCNRNSILKLRTAVAAATMIYNQLLAL
jgi:hypothetical protein